MKYEKNVSEINLFIFVIQTAELEMDINRKKYWFASLVEGLVCLTTDHEVAGSIPGTYETGSTQPREDNW